MAEVFPSSMPRLVVQQSADAFTKEKCHESTDVVISKFIRENCFGFSLILYTVTLSFQPRTLSAIFSFCTSSFSRSLKGVGKGIPE